MKGTQLIDYSYRNGTTIEHLIELSWYGSESDPVSILRWSVEDAQIEFTRRTAYSPVHRSYKQWVKRIIKAEKIIKKHLAEALLSESPYLREYARLLSERKRKSREFARLFREQKREIRK